MLLIPGLACSSAVWNTAASHFESRYRLHLVQVAGFAGSPAGANAHGPVIQPSVEAIADYIKSNNLKAPAVIGHSLGGFMGMLLAARHPGSVGKLMIVDSLPFFSVLMGATNSAEIEPRAATLRDMILNENQETYAQGEKMFLRGMVKSPEGYDAAVAWAVASDKSVVARAMYEAMTTDLRPKLPEIKIPVTVLYPWDATSDFPEEAVDKLYHDNFAPLPRKTLIRIDGSRHFIMFDQPDKFSAEVAAFLK